jgi:hypothetical protein
MTKRAKEPKSCGRTYKGEVTKPRGKKSTRVRKILKRFKRSATHRVRQTAKKVRIAFESWCVCGHAIEDHGFSLNGACGECSCICYERSVA